MLASPKSIIFKRIYHDNLGGKRALDKELVIDVLLVFTYN